MDRWPANHDMEGYDVFADFEQLKAEAAFTFVKTRYCHL